MSCKFVTVSSLCALALAVSLGAAAAQPLTVVELFTSQGCSSCPPANANLIKVKDQPGVLALSFNVTYWDYLGWKDIFGRPEFTERQAVYEPALGEQGSFTPQMVIDGRASTVGFRLSDVESLISAARAEEEPAIELIGGEARIGAGKAPSDGADVWLVRYDPNLVQVPVERGENSGATLPHTHVVHALTRLGSWNGAAALFAIPPAAAGLRTAILVQGRQGGPILSARTD